uniref:Major facilitator superfamily (MFS) profile domain-containing protein n=1 Tax=Plectus sambesii TaxID=2011161 RepID=A0A914X0S2_9BILA
MALMRTNLAVALVCMVNSSVLLEQNSSQLSPNETLNSSFNRSQNDSATGEREHACLLAPDEDNEYNGELNWTPTQISLIFSAVSWGGLLTGFFSGWVADRYGPKNILLAACVVHVIGSFLTPTIAVRVGFYGMVGIRFIMGLGQGVIIPCMGALIARWFPSTERSTAIAIYTTGKELGTMIANPVGAFLCGTESFFGGWPAIFYVFGKCLLSHVNRAANITLLFVGTIGVVWCICWLPIVSNSPENNRLISKKELMYLQQELKSQSLQNRKVATQHVPWAKMFRSGPILAQVMMNGAAACFMGVYQSYLPTYFMQNGLLSALPPLVQMVVKMFVSRLSDRLKQRVNKPNSTTLCKVFNSIGAFGSALCLVAISFLDCRHVPLAVFLICASFAAFASFAPGFFTSQISIAPVYSGIVSSFSRVCAQVGQIAAPSIVGFFVGTRREWQYVQLILAAFMTAGGVVFLIFGSAEIQPWAMTPNETQVALAEDESEGDIDDSVIGDDSEKY